MSELWVQHFVGLPFKTDGACPKTGVDCWNLVRLVLAEQKGLTLPRQGEAVGGWSLCRDTPQPFDVVLMGSIVGRGSRTPPHVGIMIDAQRMLHVDEAGPSHVLPLNHPFVRVRSFDIYRHISLSL